MTVQKPGEATKRPGGCSPVMQSNAHYSDRARPLRRDGRPFDDWLERQLHDLYDSIAQEPLPGDLARLVRPNANSPSGTDGQSLR